MTGGGSQLFGLDTILSDQIRIRFMVAENPQDCVAVGASRILEDPDTLGKVVFNQEKQRKRNKRQ